jgi:hypothetical protein
LTNQHPNADELEISATKVIPNQTLSANKKVKNRSFTSELNLSLDSDALESKRKPPKSQQSKSLPKDKEKQIKQANGGAISFQLPPVGNLSATSSVANNSIGGSTSSALKF